MFISTMPNSLGRLTLGVPNSLERLTLVDQHFQVKNYNMFMGKKRTKEGRHTDMKMKKISHRGHRVFYFSSVLSAANFVTALNASSNG
jgi:hypothetical protein